MPTTNPTAASHLIDALTSYSNTAATTYASTLERAHDEPKTSGTADEKAEDEKQIQRAQAMNASAFSQLATAAKLESEQHGRAGYLAVVQLMQTTADTAKNVCVKLEALLHATPGDAVLPQTADVPVINALADVLRALGELSPDSTWGTPATPVNQ